MSECPACGRALPDPEQDDEPVIVGLGRIVRPDPEQAVREALDLAALECDAQEAHYTRMSKWERSYGYHGAADIIRKIRGARP